MFNSVLHYQVPSGSQEWSIRHYPTAYSQRRTGTLSLYQALKILGYRPYHGAEVVANGVSHLEIFEEALNAKYFGVGKPYGKVEFDKWFADYDVRTAPDPKPLQLLMRPQSLTRESCRHWSRSQLSSSRRLLLLIRTPSSCTWSEMLISGTGRL